MAWQAADSLLVLRDQVNVLAPNRSRASDGLVCDENHPTGSDHCPHFVEGIGRDVVTALDLTHDPGDGFDSFQFAEVLRKHRDNRVKYVISNGRMFSSYATSSYAAWTWRPYTGSSDPHTNHVHLSVLDAQISDSRVPWNLDGFGDDMTADDFLAILNDPKVAAKMKAFGWQYQDPNQPSAHSLLLAENGLLRTSLRDTEVKLAAILAKLEPSGDTVLPTEGTFTGTWTSAL